MVSPLKISGADVEICGKTGGNIWLEVDVENDNDDDDDDDGTFRFFMLSSRASAARIPSEISLVISGDFDNSKLNFGGDPFIL